MQNTRCSIASWSTFSSMVCPVLSYELSEQLAVSGSMTPLIFFTAHEDSEVLSQTIRTPFAGFIGKNEPSAAVFAAIDKAIHVGC